MVRPEYPAAQPGSPYQDDSHPGAQSDGPSPDGPYPGQPYSGPPYPDQPYPGQPYSGPPSSGQPYPGQPYSGPPSSGQPYSGPPYPGQPYPGQPYSGQPYPGQQYPGAVAAPRRRGPLIAVVVGAAVILVITIAGIGIAASGGGSHGTSPTGAAAGASSSPKASPSPAALTPDAYQDLLGKLDQSLVSGVQAVQNAHGRDAVGAALSALQTGVNTGVAPFIGAHAPSSAQSANDAFVTAMQDFSRKIGELAPPVSNFLGTSGKGFACLASTAMESLTSPATADGVRNASKELASVDPAHAYKVGTFLPGPAAGPKGAPGNGTVIKRSGPGGLGTLTVKNQGDTDVAVSLVPTSSKSASAVMYVRAGGEGKLSNIHDGSYNTYVAEGSAWDSGAKAFGRDCGFSQMSGTADYKTGGGTYTTYTLTLHAGTGGNATSTPVDPGSFPG